MARLVVEVVGASDLMPKDGQGSASSFVEVRFADQTARTRVRPKDLNPEWREKLVFNVESEPDLARLTVEAVVYNQRERDGADGGGQRNFLGQVKISGERVAPAESEAQIDSYPLQKRSPFSHIKGEIALKMYLTRDASAFPHPQDPRSKQPERHPKEPNFVSDRSPSPPVKAKAKVVEEDHKTRQQTTTTKKKKEKKELRTFHSVAAAPAPGPPPAMETPYPIPGPPPGSGVEMRSDFARAGPAPAATVMHMQVPRPNPEFQLVETRPPLPAARVGYKGVEKMAGTYDLVEQMQYLYVNVVKARDLPVMDVTGSLDPYVEVRLGNYKGVTKHLEKTQYPVWNQIFAFPKGMLQSGLLEVTLKDKDLITKDDLVGRVWFELSEIPLRVPPDSPLAAQWYKLEGKHGIKAGCGELMLAVWMGTQADESFPEAWHADAHSLRPESLASTRAKVYFSPKLYYLRVHVLEAQDILIHDRTRQPQLLVRVQLGIQRRDTSVTANRSANTYQWNDELMFVASEPFEEVLVVTVLDRLAPGKEEPLGVKFIPVREVPHRSDVPKALPPEPRWFSLQLPSLGGDDEAERKKKEVRFASKIQLRVCLDVGYHVLDESTHFSSDLQPSSKFLRKSSIGILELGILSARNLPPVKARDGRVTDAYCVAKYGNKWIRTRTFLNTQSPTWNEQYTWDVFDPCTVITVGVFDNAHINGPKEGDSRDQRIGKVRIRLSTLQIDKIYTHYYPLLALQPPNGLRKHGELQLAVRFTCTAWVNMVTQYSQPLLPRMHYVHPISVRHIDWLRHQAMQIVAARLNRSEPPLRREVVEYMLDVDYHMWSLRRSKANFHRIMSVLSCLTAVGRWFHDVCMWRNPVTTCLVHVLFLILVCYPELILPTFFLYLFVIGMWNYRFRPRQPPHMDARLSHAESTHPDELDEEFDTFPTSRPSDIVKMRYDRLRSLAGRVQTVVGDLATQGERALALLSWRDPRATAVFIIFSLIFAVLVYVTPFQVVAMLFGLYWLRHPRFRTRLPSVPINFFKRLPSKSDMLI